MSPVCLQKLRRLRHHRARLELPILTRDRRTFGIVAAAAVFASSLTSIVNCATRCVLTSAGALNCGRTAAETPPCHGNPNSDPVSVPASHDAGDTQECPSRSCPGQHSISILQAVVTPTATLSPVRGPGSGARLGPWSPSAMLRPLPQIPARRGFSHSPPRTSGRSICKQESRFRI